MAFDIAEFSSSLLGSAVAIVGSIAVPWMYVRNENKKASKTRLYERIQETFFDKGLSPMESALLKQSSILRHFLASPTRLCKFAKQT